MNMPAANKESVISLVHRANPKINFWSEGPLIPVSDELAAM